MFRLLKVQALLARDFNVAGAGAGWRVARVDMMGGLGSDSSVWSIALAQGGRTRLMPWHAFLAEATVAGEKSPVGEFLAGLLGRVASRLQDRTRRRDVTRALRQGLPAGQALELLVQGEHAVADWLQTGRGAEPAGLLQPADLLAALAADVDADRELLRRPAAAAAARPVTMVAVPASAEAAPGTRANPLYERIEQALAACRDLLTLAGARPSPGRAEAVAHAVVSGALEAWLDERLRALFPDQASTAAARIDRAAPPAGGPAAHLFAADLALDLPLWSLKQRSRITVHLSLSIDSEVRPPVRMVEEVVRDADVFLREWAASRRRPLVSGGDGWLGLLPAMPWDADLFARWLAAAPLFERVARVAAIGHAPESREKQSGWQALLAGVLADGDALRAGNWQALAPHLSLWDAGQQTELIAALRRAILGRIKAEEAATLEIEEWLDAWRLLGAPGPTRIMLAGLCGRAERTRHESDVEMAFHFWRETHSPPADVHLVAALWKDQPGCTADLAAEMAGVLPETDPRRSASAAIAAAVAAAAPGQSALALGPLAQAAAEPGEWLLDGAWRGELARLYDTWSAGLDRSQQHAAWRQLLEHRGTLIRCGLLEA